VAEEIGDESAAQILVDTLMGEKLVHVEEIPRMRAIERGGGNCSISRPRNATGERVDNYNSV
jgi:hypothetical protein